ncbi:MAG: hypothetical protein ACE5JI_03915 [Acidobacteriota bacterium]
MELRTLLERLGPSTTAAEVMVLLEHPDVDEAHVLAALRNRNLAGAAIETIARQERWRRRHRIRAAIANHPKTPKTLALRLLNLLFWKELLRVSGNYRLSMPLRVAAERQLRDRLPELELGEKITLARSAPTGLVSALVREGEARIIQALVTNPRLRETEVLSLVESPKSSPEVLRAVADSERWSARYPVKVAVVKNPRTPVHAALRLLSTLPREKLARLVTGQALPKVVRVGAERILAGQPIRRSWAR